MINDFQSVVLMTLVVIMLFVFAWLVAKMSNKRDADSIEVELLREAMVKMAEHTAQAEEHASAARGYAARIKRLQAKGVKLPDKNEGRWRRVDIKQNPPHRSPPSPPNPTARWPINGPHDANATT